MEDALWIQGLRKNLEQGKRRHEFQADHGLRKWFKTRCEISGMKPINIEKLMGHSIGIPGSYYRATERELLDDYMKAIDFLTISNENKLQKQMQDVMEQSKINNEYYEGNLEIANSLLKILLNQMVDKTMVAAVKEKLSHVWYRSIFYLLSY
jgi:hypothetical protein